jgi:hypothetical protein
MKKLLLSLAMVGFFATVNAQDAKQPAQSAEQRAITQTQKASKQLQLSIEQESKFKNLALARNNSIEAIRSKAKASTDKAVKQAAKAEAKTVRDKFNADVNAMLTPEQQPKWAAHVKKMQEKQGQNQQD